MLEHFPRVSLTSFSPGMEGGREGGKALSAFLVSGFANSHGGSLHFSYRIEELAHCYFLGKQPGFQLSYYGKSMVNACSESLGTPCQDCKHKAVTLLFL